MFKKILFGFTALAERVITPNSGFFQDFLKGLFSNKLTVNFHNNFSKKLVNISLREYEIIIRGYH